MINSQIISIKNKLEKLSKIPNISHLQYIINMYCICGHNGNINIRNLNMPVICKNCNAKNSIKKITISIIDPMNNIILDEVNHKIFEYILMIHLAKDVKLLEFSHNYKENNIYIILEYSTLRQAKAFYIAIAKLIIDNKMQYKINIRNNIIRIKNLIKNIDDINYINFFKIITQNILLFEKDKRGIFHP